MDLSQWPIFSLLNEEFRQAVQWACVFGTSGNEAILILRGDEVHALGTNSNCCLGLGTSSSGLHPRRVETLCGIGDCGYHITFHYLHSCFCNQILFGLHMAVGHTSLLSPRVERCTVGATMLTVSWG